MPEENPLQEEYRYYESIKANLIGKSKGKFALVKGKELVGTFDTDQDAYKAGLLKYGNTPFLIIRITEVDETGWIPILELGLLSASD